MRTTVGPGPKDPACGSIGIADAQRDGMSRPQRLKRFTYVGPFRYFLTICTRDRTAAFCSADTVHRTLMEFLRLSRHEQFALLAYCFMPDHVHLLVEGTRHDSDLAVFVQAAKRCSGTAYAAIHGRPLWQEGCTIGC